MHAGNALHVIDESGGSIFYYK